MHLEIEHKALDEGNSACILTLNRPEKANALNAAIVTDLLGVLTGLGSETRAVVIRSNSKNFCAGFDLDIDDENEQTIVARFTGIGLLLDWLYRAPYVTVAAIRGAAVGAGADLAMACDFRVATAEASLRFPGASFGAVLGVRRLASLTSSAQAIRLATSGTRLSADDAHSFGLFTDLVPVDGLDNAVLTLARQVGSVSAEALGGILLAARADDGGSGIADLMRSVSLGQGLRARMIEYRDRPQTSN